MVRGKPRHEQSRKERKTQERKRRAGLFGKGHQYARLSNVNVAIFVYNAEDDRFYTYLSTTQSCWPPSLDVVKSHPKSQVLTVHDFTDAGKRKPVHQDRSYQTTPVVKTEGSPITLDSVEPFPDPPLWPEAPDVDLGDLLYTYFGQRDP